MIRNYEPLQEAHHTSGLSHYPAHRPHTKFSLGALRGHCNVAGFNQIASYLYGYPFGLDFAKGYPRFGSGRVHDGGCAARS